MKISELMQELAEFRVLHGDIEAVTDGEWDWGDPDLTYDPSIRKLVIR
ncbi:hypothetical protein [Nocardia abscessus]|nr:hypothetical protein [Nocardia abscessus]